MADIKKIREELIAAIPRDCLDCDACGKSNPRHQCLKCYTAHYCSSECLRKLSSHQCHDIETMRNALIGIGDSLDISQAKNETCGICLETPMVDPAVLPHCQHAFCRPCLREWHGMEKFSKEIKCPTCKGVLLFDESEDNPIEKAKIFGARAKKAESSNRPNDKIKLCRRALDDLEVLLSKDESNLSALFIKAEILLIQSKPQSALDVIDTILRMDHENRTNRKTVSNYLDQAQVAQEAAERERIMKLVEEIAGAKGEKIGTILQTLVDVFLLQAEAYQQLGDWFTAKDIYQDLLGLGPGIAKWILIAVALAVVVLVTFIFGAYEGHSLSSLSPSSLEVTANDITIIRQVTATSLVATILYGTLGRFLVATPKSKSKVLTFAPELRAPVVSQQRASFMAMVKCYYHLKEYDNALQVGALALHMNRHFPGVHEYIAKTYQAKGDTKKAIKTMHRAVLYETPWDVENIETQLQLLQEINATK